MIDANQAIAQLTALGYKPDDRVHLRLIAEGGAVKRDCLVNRLATVQQPPGHHGSW